jgi:CCR4-NOT transcription complex subunit 2
MEGGRSLSNAASNDRFLRQNSSEILAFLGSKGPTPPPLQQQAGAATAGGLLSNSSNSRGVAPFDPSEFPSLGRSSSASSGISGNNSLPMSVASVVVGAHNQQQRTLGSSSVDGLYSENFPALPQSRNLLGTSGVGGSSMPLSLSSQSSLISSNPFTQAVQQQQQLQHSQSNNSRHDLTVAGNFGLMGLMGVIRMEDPDRGSLALGTDLTTLGLNLNSNDSLHTIFSGPWDDSSRDALFSLPPSYPRKATVRPEILEKVNLETLFVCFYSMPRDVLQVLAAQELINRGWRFHEELRLWFSQAKNGSIVFFDVHAWERRIFSGRLPDGFESGFLPPDVILSSSRAALAQLSQPGRTVNSNTSVTGSGSSW